MIDVMIIGGGPAGMTAGLYAARRGLKASVFERLMVGGQASTTNIIDRKSTRQNSSHILCMGAQPRKLDVPGEELFRGRGVSYCATCDGAFYRGKNVLVVGGGNTAAEDALYLAGLCEKVYVAHRRDELRADAASAARIAQTPNIEMLWSTVVTEFAGGRALERAQLKQLKTGQTSELEIAGAFIAVGQTPLNDLVKGQLELDEAGFIVAGEDTATAIPGVFAAGDIRTKPLRQVVTAASDGAVAASMAGRYISML